MEEVAYLSALSGLLGATIGGMTSFGTAWLTQRNQVRNARREVEKAKREALFGDFIAEATRLYADALSHEKDDVTGLVRIGAADNSQEGICLHPSKGRKQNVGNALFRMNAR